MPDSEERKSLILSMAWIFWLNIFVFALGVAWGAWVVR